MTHLDELEAALSGGRLVRDPDIIESYRRDEAHLVVPGMPIGVLEASCTADVVAAARWATRHHVPLVARGGGTGLAGAATAVEGCLVVSTRKMDQVLEMAVDDGYAVVQPGLINADLDAAANAVGLMYAPDPSSREISTIGGNIATNAGGLRCVKYGVTRESVLGLEVVLADGRVLRTGRRTVKGVAGLDLTSLFVGSEGTLGIVTEATVRLRPRPPGLPVTVVGTFPDLASAGAAASATVSAGVGPSLLELIDGPTLVSIEEWKGMGLEDVAAMLIGQTDGHDAQTAAARMAEVFEAAGAAAVVVSDDALEADRLLEVRRLAYPAAERLGACLVEDVGVPRSHLAAMITAIEEIAVRHDVRILTVAHAGDGNLHPTFVFDPTPSGDAPAEVWAAADEVFRSAIALGGTLTGEHGVGALKTRWLGLELGEDVLEVQRALKATLDPLGLLNPGKAV